MRRVFVIELLLIVTVSINLCIFYYNRRYIPLAHSLEYGSTHYDNKTYLVETHRYGTEFCVAYNVTKAQNSFRQNGLEPITLAAHTTSSYIQYITEQVETWDGPISLSLFIDRNSREAVQLIVNQHKCSEKFAGKVSLHVVYRLSAFQEECHPINIDLIPCMNFTAKYKNKMVNRMISPFGIYPINVVRNVARKGAPSHIQIISDIEMIFSKNFTTDVTPLANEHIRNGTKKLIVVRRFELDNSIKKVPRDVIDLKIKVDNKKAFEFHHEIFPIGHTIAGLWHWFRKSNESTTTSLWEIPYKGPSWEPQFIMHSSDPMSEEGMPTRIRDQQALTYELCRANYTFLLLTRHFNVHRGVKRTATNLDAAVRHHQGKLRYKSFRRFIDRIEASYPNATNRCRNFIM